MKRGIYMALGVVAIAGTSLWAYRHQWQSADEESRYEFDVTLAKSDLWETVRDIELYKVAFGTYPAQLKDIRAGFSHYDSATKDCGCGDDSDFFYNLNEARSTYVLFSRGRDCKAFTADDIQPVLRPVEANRAGWRVPAGKVADINTAECPGAQPRVAAERPKTGAG